MTALLVFLGLIGTPMPGATTASQSCGQIHSGGSALKVTVGRGHVGCAVARRVLRTFLNGGGVEHGGPYAYDTYWTVGKWRCSSGAGGGSCIRGGSTYAKARDYILASTTAASSRVRPWCTVKGSYNSYYEDYDVYVHSNQPYRDAQVWQKGRDIYGYKTNSDGYADVYIFADEVNATEGISIRVGRARCSGRL